VLTFHGLRATEEPVPGMLDQDQHVPVTLFAEVCEHLARHYHVIHARELAEAQMQGAPFPARSVAITFDDGYQNNLDNALPILLKNGFTATCYAVSSLIGGTNLWDKGKVEEKPLMTLENWRTWRDAGMDIGSHTRTHADLTGLSADEARNEITLSKRELEDAIGCEIRHFCYPYGLFTPPHSAITKESGFITATTTQRGRVVAGDDLYALRRILITRSTNVFQYLLKLISTYEDRRG
jgi:peptidoglycan/xylan/chitin deacetylase (PgdA/CDA1 family)